jgi:hypothetical protein
MIGMQGYLYTMSEIVICLTGTIVPNTTHVVRNDVLQRVEDYVRAIDFYLSNTDQQIIFAENSDYDLNSDERFQKFMQMPRFRVMRFTAHPDSSKGKGFQEFNMLDQLVASLPPNALLVKITGRYIVRNIKGIIEKLSEGFTIDLHRKKKVAITGLFAVSTSIYREYITGIFAEADDANGRFIEHVLYDRIDGNDLISYCTLLPENPRFEGISGSHGAALSRNKYKMMVRRIERSLSRNMGIRKFLIEY